MSSYTEVIAPPRSPDCSRARAEVRVSLLSALLLPSLGTAIFAVGLLQVLFLSGGARALFRDSDTGWHIRAGETMLASRAIPHADSYSYTHAGRSWYAWEWLSDALLGGAHRLAGPSGVALLAAAAIALAAWGAARLALSLGGNLFFTAAATVLLLGTTSIHWLARPHLFSWLLALAFVAVAEHQRRGRPVRALYLLPLLACLWANMHGSFLLGPAILLLYAAGEWLNELRSSGVRLLLFRWSSDADTEGLPRSRHALRFAAAGLASLLATFINPYGWQLHAHVVSYLRNDYLMDRISEFRSFSFHHPGAIYVELFLLVAVAGCFALLRQRAYGPALLALALLHMSLYAARHLPTSAVLLLPLSVVALTEEAGRWPSWRRFLAYSARLQAINQRVLGAVPLLAVLIAAPAAMGGLARAGKVGFDPARFPVRAAAFLEQRETSALRVFTKDQWGGYLIYRFEARLKVFVDGRSDFYGQDLLERYAQVVEVKPGWENVLAQERVNAVLVPPGHVLASTLATHSAWRRVYADAVATVFERKN